MIVTAHRFMPTRQQIIHASIIAAAFCGLALRAVASGDNAAAAPPPSPADASAVVANKSELVLFGEFLDQNPMSDARLREDPTLLSDAAFLRNHPHTKEHLDQHPTIKADLANNPRWFVIREFVKQSEPPATPQQIADFEQYLDEHPEAARQLIKSPAQLTRPEFLNANAGARSYVSGRSEASRVTVPRSGAASKRAITVPKRPVVRRPAGKGR